jgi:hypothetical protein
MNAPKIGQCYLTGTVNGVWDKDSKKFVIKRGKTKNDKKYQVFTIATAKKDKDGKWTNGKGIRVTLFGDTKVEEKMKIGVIGSFEPNVGEKDGKEVKYDDSFVSFEMFEPSSWDSKSETKPKEDEDDNPWND